MTRIFWVLLLVSINGSFVFSQTSKENRRVIKSIDDLISKRLEKISPGCVVFVSKKGRVFYKKAFGTADLELNIPMEPGMVFRLGSITKQFTAIAILKLVEQEKISLADSVQKFIKDFNTQGQVITIENLLTQTSGLPDYIDLDYDTKNPFRVDFPVKLIIDSIKRFRLDFKPGSKFAYSNSNYFLLGYIIELMSGKSFADFLKENIFIPAGLTNTFYENPAEIIPNRIKGYERAHDKYVNADFISMAVFYSAGALMSNAEDLFKWNQALITYQIVKKETLEKAFRPYRLPDGKLSEYGYGWFIRKIAASNTIEHGGSIFGFRAKEIYLPNEDIYIVGLFNCRQPDNNESDLCLDIAKTMLGEPLEKDIVLADNILNSYIGTYVFVEKTSMSIKIYKKDGRLYADLSNGTGMHMTMLAQSSSLFALPDVRRVPTTIEFIMEGNTIKGLIWTQEQRHEATRKD